MTSRSSSRWLGPIALGVAIVAVLFVISASTGGDESSPTTGTGGSTEERREARTSEDGTSTSSTTSSTTTTGSERKTYRVRPGDTLQTIAERTDVTVEELQELNPDIDPNALTVGQRIKLTE